MPTQLTECLSCPRCLKVFNAKDQKPISLGCGHTVCQKCLINLLNKKCPNCQSEQSIITKSVEQLPVNYALLQLVGIAIPDKERPDTTQMTENSSLYESCKKYVEELAVHMKSISDAGVESDDEDESVKYDQGSTNSILSRPMQRKLVTLINSQLVEEEGRARAMRAARSLGERAVAELILQHQNPQQLSANLWAAVRARGCQFLGPAMQEEVLKLILLALVDGSALCRKVLVLFVVQKLEATYPQASKTAIGHVVQLLYRASCFKVTKKEEESSLMQLKEEFRTYESLRREHDSQIVQIAMEAGLRISPEQWSSLLYGDSSHKSHMQSIIDKLQTSESFTQSVNELMVVLQKTGDPAQLQSLQPHLQFLAMIDPSQDKQVPSWKNLEAILKTLKTVINGLINYLNNYSHKKSDILPAQNARYKTSMCRDFTNTRSCPRGINCSFAHSEEELERFRAKKKFSVKSFVSTMSTSAALTPKERQELAKVNTKSGMFDIRNMAAVTEDIRQNRIESSTLKNLPATNVVKPMMSTLATKTVSLTTDTTPSMATTAIPSISTTSSIATNSYHNGNIASITQRHLAPRIPAVTLQPDAVYYPPQTAGRLPTPSQIYTPPQPSVRQPLTGAAARYPPQPYPASLPYQPDQPPPCAHGYPNYPFDGQVPPINYPSQWNQPPGPAPFYMPGMPPPVYQDKYGRYQSMPPVPTIQPVQPTVPIQNVVQPAVQQLPQGTVQPTPFPNQVNSLQDLQTRRQEILSHIHHNIQLTPIESDQPQLIARGASNTSQANKRDRTSMPICTKRGYSSAVSLSDQHNMFNGLSQTEKAYTILKKELFNNPQQAPDPRDLSWPTPPISVNAVAEFEDQMTQSCPPSNNEVNVVTESKKSSCSTSVDDDDFNLFCVSLDEDLEIDGDESYTQWSGGIDWSKPSSSSSQTSSSSTISVDLFDWFEKQSMPCNFSQRSSEFIPFDPPVVSRFGPISRAARSKLKNSDPVIVTADEAIMKMTPVTAITPTQRPYPVTSPAPSRYKIPGQSVQTNNTQATPGEPHTLWHQHSNLSNAHRSVGGRQLHQELNRLEHNANEAPTQDERLAYELQAIELKISMRTGKRPDPIEQPDLGNIEPPANSALSPPSQQQRTALHMAAVEAQIERKDELSLRQQQEEIDRKLAEKLIMEELKSKKYSRK